MIRHDEGRREAECAAGFVFDNGGGFGTFVGQPHLERYVPTAGRHPTNLAAISVLVAVAFVSSADTATAGCGDYVTVLNKDGTAAGQHHPAMPGAPCHGPNCSAERNPPPAAPATTPLSHLGGAKEAAATLTVVEQPTPSFASRVPLRSSGRPVHRSAEPFIPPRSV